MYLILRQVALHSPSFQTKSPKQHSHQVGQPLAPRSHYHVLLIRPLAEQHEQGGALHLSLSVLLRGRTFARASELSSALNQRRGR